MNSGILIIGLIVVFFSFLLSGARFLSCLLVLENLNVLLLFLCLLSHSGDFRVLFVALIVVFTIEAVVCLSSVIRLCESSVLSGLFFW